MSDRQVINYLIKYYNLRRLRDWKKQKWDNSEKNNKVIQGLQHIREELDRLEKQDIAIQMINDYVYIDFEDIANCCDEKEIKLFKEVFK